MGIFTFLKPREKVELAPTNLPLDDRITVALAADSIDFSRSFGVEAAIGHDVHRLRFNHSDPHGYIARLLPRVKEYAAAYEDQELSEITRLCSPYIHVSSFWGVVRGPTAFAVVGQQEKQSVAVTWTTPFRPLTPVTYVRDGYCYKSKDLHHKGSFASRWVPTPLQGYFLKKEPVREHICINPSTEKIVFRSFGKNWGFDVA